MGNACGNRVIDSAILPHNFVCNSSMTVLSYSSQGSGCSHPLPTFKLLPLRIIKRCLLFLTTSSRNQLQCVPRNALVIIMIHPSLLADKGHLLAVVQEHLSVQISVALDRGLKSLILRHPVMLLSGRWTYGALNHAGLSSSLNCKL